MGREPIDKGSQHDPPAAHSPLEIDFEKYLEFTQHFDTSEEQQRELLTALVQILTAHVDIALGIDPTSTACGSSYGEVGEIIRSQGHQASDVVELPASEITGAFNKKRGAA